MSPFLIAFDGLNYTVMASDYTDALDIAGRLIDLHVNTAEITVREIDGQEFEKFIRSVKSNRRRKHAAA